MNSKWHLIISDIKSVVRIAGCIGAIVTKSIVVLSVFLLIAEILGILEEVGDKRD